MHASDDDVSDLGGVLAAERVDDDEFVGDLDSAHH